MAIQILSSQLANQIAAGEVVERPASVVKELVENSLDAGATRIQIDIDKGGAKRIAIRDNGCGIGKDELTLALARHATSKIACLDDLEAIMSLGFRGEALASISAVSRLTLTSRPEQQPEAWQAYAEGRDMAVNVKPAAHPPGSTLEVLDLFYNTPARRKFLRSEKTEFTHIDEVIRRIALARFDVEMVLTHNGKQVRHYRAAKDERQTSQRLAAVCGKPFSENATHIDWQHGELALSGWVVAHQQATHLAELQYCYVNGRTMRDKLINHAIRQAYQELAGPDLHPAYVLFLRVDPHQVDVNVHPAKHEVRFHQARLVHDFIYQGIASALQSEPGLEMQGGEPLHFGHNLAQNRSAAGINMFTADVQARPAAAKAPTDRALAEPKATVYRPSYDQQTGQLYQTLLAKPEPSQDNGKQLADDRPLQATALSFGRVLGIHAKRFALLENHQGLVLLALSKAAELLISQQLQPASQPLKSQPLLIPLRLKMDRQERQRVQDQQQRLVRMGIDLQLEGQHCTLRAVPLPIRSQNLQILIRDMVGYLVATPEVDEPSLAQWLAAQCIVSIGEWSQSQAIGLLAELERMVPDSVTHPPRGLLQPVDLQSTMNKLINQ